MVARRHLGYFIDCFGEHKALFHMRKHLCWYSRGLPGAATFRAAINRVQCMEELLRRLDSFFLGDAAAERSA